MTDWELKNEVINGSMVFTPKNLILSEFYVKGDSNDTGILVLVFELLEGKNSLIEIFDVTFHKNGRTEMKKREMCTKNAHLAKFNTF